MSGLSLVRYESIAALRAAESAWDDLWQRSDGVLPTGRAGFIADWLEQFGPNAKFTAVAVEQDGQLVAALPLVGRKIAKTVKVASLPWNSWCWAGDLLLDSSLDASQVLPRTGGGNASIAVATAMVRHRCRWKHLAGDSFWMR